ncbi:MAG: ABC transporter ATP-binding protein [Myxococcota bacterium]|nr:ABC transporter ATP-binding protein [Myxococcota bacterium]
MTRPIVELFDAKVAYDDRCVLDVPHLAIERGEILTLLGENGSGKTTLLRLLGLLIEPECGRVVFDGEDVDFGKQARLLELRRKMAAVMQQPLLCRMSVSRNVGLGLRFRRLPKVEVKKRVNDWLERLSISHLADRRALKLSGGEAQRTSLARAMVLNPEVLMLDEPFASLDAPTRHNLQQEFRDVLAESDVTTVFATHDRGEAITLGNRVAVLMRGSVAQVGSIDSVFSKPTSLETARFVGIETIIPGRVASEANDLVTVDCGEISIQASGDYAVSGDVYAAIRSEEIDVIERLDSSENSGTNVLFGRVSKVLPEESLCRVMVDCGVPVVAAVNRARIRDTTIDVGSSVCVKFPVSATHLIKRGS